MAMIRSLRLGRTNHLGRYGSEQAGDHDEAQRGAGVISAKETRPPLGGGVADLGRREREVRTSASVTASRADL